jgi:hypothetical protein
VGCTAVGFLCVLVTVRLYGCVAAPVGAVVELVSAALLGVALTPAPRQDGKMARGEPGREQAATRVAGMGMEQGRLWNSRGGLAALANGSSESSPWGSCPSPQPRSATLAVAELETSVFCVPRFNRRPGQLRVGCRQCSSCLSRSVFLASLVVHYIQSAAARCGQPTYFFPWPVPRMTD